MDNVQGSQSSESHPSETANYSWIVNDLIKISLHKRVDDRKRYPVWVDSIELSIGFVLGRGQHKPDALKKVNKDIEKIHNKFDKQIEGKTDKEIIKINPERYAELLVKYDEKLEILLEKYNEWVQLFKKPVTRSISQKWTAQ